MALEDRTVPATFAVQLVSAPSGVLGDTDAAHSGSLAIGNSGTVEANDAAHAIALALTGTESVTFGGTTVDYAFGTSTVGYTTGDQRAFLIKASGADWRIALEDLAGFAGSQCDWDYNDHFWFVSVSQTAGADPIITEPPPMGPPASPPPSENHSPTANNDFATIDEDTSVTLDVLTNDTDPDGDTLSVTCVGTAMHGTVTSVGSSVTYTPDANWNGTDFIGYSIEDEYGAPAMASFNITVTPVNDPPVANADSAATNEDTAVTVNVADNDTDIDNDALFVESAGGAAHGTVTPNGAAITYTPEADWFGADSFVYTISDGHGGTATSSVSVIVTPVNDPPVAVNDEATTDEDTAVTVNLTANDTDVDEDSLSVVSVGSAGHGSVMYDGSSVTYTPDANWYGTDAFGYTISGSSDKCVLCQVDRVNA